MATNIETAVKGKILTITVDLSKDYGRTGGGEGKNIKIGTSGGGRGIEMDVDGVGEVAISCNVYRRPKAGE